ncbi:MAG TPA: LdpA C-terminal domain-containing domain [Candidatus Gastranaerophilales bacterium]|nr:LdpA C-terminal domain-containing domain [Candidatus Gastranaerophilales bacterium]
MTEEKIKKIHFSKERVLNALETGSFRKIICGASNTSEKQVERLSLVYSLCGAEVIDISAYKHIYNAAKRGIIAASEIAGLKPDIYPKFNIPAIMKSLNVGDDKHFKKANFNLTRCISCLECVKTCQSGALSKDSGKSTFESEKCYGCARCVEACQQNAVTMVKVDRNAEEDKPDIGKFDALEIHTGNSSIEEVKRFVDFNKNIMEKANFISVSVDSMRFNSAELLEYVNSVINMFKDKIIVQIDGISMRGGTKNSSTVQTIAAAAVLLDAKVNAYIQLSGGTNHLTSDFVNLAGLKISGIGYGTFAKKIILSYIEDFGDDEFKANLHKIVTVAVKLIEK